MSPLSVWYSQGHLREIRGFLHAPAPAAGSSFGHQNSASSSNTLIAKSRLANHFNSSRSPSFARHQWHQFDEMNRRLISPLSTKLSLPTVSDPPLLSHRLSQGITLNAIY